MFRRLEEDLCAWIDESVLSLEVLNQQVGLALRDHGPRCPDINIPSVYPGLVRHFSKLILAD